MKTTVEIEPTPKQMAQAIWNMYSDEQAEMFYQLLKIAGSEHNLMSQFLTTRDHCEKRNDGSLGAFQAMFSCAYRHFQLEADDWREFRKHVDTEKMIAMRAVLTEAVEYLDINELTQISSTSIMHRKMKEVLGNG